MMHALRGNVIMSYFPCHDLRNMCVSYEWALTKNELWIMVSSSMVALKWYLVGLVVWDAILTLHKYSLVLPKVMDLICWNDLYVGYGCTLFFLYYCSLCFSKFACRMVFNKKIPF